MNKNILINGIQYQNVSNIKVKDAETTDLHSFVNVDEADITPSDVILGKVGYGKNGKIFGSYVPPSGEIEKEINFYDAYGQWLTGYRLEDLPLSELPEIPILGGAGADQYELAWSMTLEEVNALTEETEIGVDVTAKEGAKTYIIPTDDGFVGSYNQLLFTGGDGSSVITVDWGDGNISSSISMTADARKTLTHTYSEPSYNPITIELISGSDFYLGEKVSPTYSRNFLQNSTSLQYISKRTKEVRIGKGVRGIMPYSFYLCSMERIIIPNSVSEFPDAGYPSYSPFYGCYRLKTLNLPKSLKNIEAGYIAISCYGLEHIYMHEGIESSKIISVSGMMGRMSLPKSYKTMNGTYFINSHYIERINLKNGSNIVCIDGFTGNSNCAALEEIDYSNLECEKLGDSFTYNNETLKQVKFPKGVKIIGSSCLSGCRCLQAIEVPEGVETIGNNFASTCDALEMVVFPSTIKSIGSSCLNNAYRLKKIIIYATEPPVLSSAISATPFEVELYVPKGTSSNYATATNWATTTTKIIEL